MWSVENNQLIIQKHKCTLVLNQRDVDVMLNKHPDIMIEAVRRGKYHRRAEQNMKRRVPHHNTTAGRIGVGKMHRAIQQIEDGWRDALDQNKT